MSCNPIRLFVIRQGKVMKKKTKSPPRTKAAIPTPSPTAPQAPPSWTFLTNHTHVLLCLYREPDQRLRDVAASVGITERMVQRIVAELVGAGYLGITKEGRCNRYSVSSKLRLRHPLEIQHTIGDLLALLSPGA